MAKSRMNCFVCTHKDRKKIERRILSQEPLAVIARDYKADIKSYVPIADHKKYHMEKALANDMMRRMPNLQVPKVVVNKEVPELDNLGECISFVYKKSLALAQLAEDEGNYAEARMSYRLNLDCLGVAMRGKELLMSYKAQGSWEAILPEILKALEPYYDAKMAVSEALETGQLSIKPEDVLQ